jgi:type II secretory pathway pseudopilin PulG
MKMSRVKLTILSVAALTALAAAAPGVRRAEAQQAQAAHQPVASLQQAAASAGLHAARSVRPAATRQSFTCTEDAFTMCLSGGRFEVVAHFDTPQGQSGAAWQVRLTDDSGYMWFFSSSNIEVVAKVLNGCGLDNAYWFFAGGLTNVHVLITVTDSITGAAVTYENLQNTAFQPIQDTDALEVCP